MLIDEIDMMSNLVSIVLAQSIPRILPSDVISRMLLLFIQEIIKHQ